MKKILSIIILFLFGVLVVSAVTITDVNSGRLFKGFQLSDLDFSLAYNVNPVIVNGGSSSDVSVADEVITRTVSATVDNDAVVLPTSLIGGLFPTFTFTSLDPSIATVDSLGNVTRVTDGTARINVRASWLTRQISVPVSRQGGQTVNQFKNWASGSLANAIKTETDTAITGYSYSTSTIANFSTPNPVINSFPSSGTGWVRSSSFYLRQYDWSGTSNWSPQGYQAGLGGICTLVSPQDCVSAHHFSLGIGNELDFYASTSPYAVESATITAQQQIPNTDIEINTLSKPLTTVLWYKILPSNWKIYLPTLGSSTIQYSATIPVVASIGGGLADSLRPHDNLGNTIHAFKAMTIQRAYSLINYVLYQSPNSPADALEDPFYVSYLGGDSGNPDFFTINNQPVLLSSIGGVFPNFIAGYISGINSVMTTNGSPYQLTTVNLTGFNTY